MAAFLVFILESFWRVFGEFLAVKTNRLTEEVYSAVTCSKIRLEVFIFPSAVFHDHHNK